jgi:hypothetical protein
MFSPHLLLAVRRGARTGTAACAALALLCALAVASPATALEQQISVTGDDLLGYSAAVQGDTLVLGAPGDADGTGAVYVFRRAGDSWTQTAKLTASDAATDSFLGSSVAIEGDTIVAGADTADVGQNADQGAVYTFARTGAPARTQTAKLTASDGAKGAFLGLSVAIDGDTIVAGAPFDNIEESAAQGSVYTFADSSRVLRGLSRGRADDQTLGPAAPEPVAAGAA